jgi:trehalose 6-phosphate synthase/phosphatase
VGRINGKYATLHNSPVHFVHGSIEFPELAALYARADVGMVTPLIDGMNLVAKEYVACHPADRPGGPGALILSEFAGAAEELSTALVVNPFDIESVVRSLRRALAMSAAERASRMAPMRRRVLSFDAPRWAQAFIDDLRATSAAPPPPRAPLDAAEALAPVRAAAQAGGKVALFLDYDGTMREIEEDPAAAFPSPAVRETLDRLLARPNFAVAVVSGRTAEDLGRWFDDPRLSLVAEHGAAMRRAGRPEWERVVTDLPTTWREEVLRLLRVYEAATPGSFVEEKHAGLVWHYRRADVEFGRWKAVRLVSELSLLTANLPLEVRHGRKIVEIALSNVSKGAAVSRLVGELQPAATLCAGDDTTDESMFRLTLPGLVTIKVGHGATKAQALVPSPAQFRDLLKELSGA